MAAELRPLILPTEADAELRSRELGHHGTARSEALRLRRRAFKIHDLSPDEAAALRDGVQALGGDALFSSAGSEAILNLAAGQLRALAALVSSEAALATRIETLADGLAPELSWVDGQGRSLLRPAGVTVMGVLNVTPDSFSDGGRHLDPILAEEAALRMVEEGADIIDVGGVSTRPGSEAPPEAEELARILPVLSRLAPRIGVPLSVDTWRASVAERAIDAGARIVNDISGFTFDPALAEVCARREVGVVLMHTPSRPADMMEHTQYRDLIRDVRLFLEQALERAAHAGIASERVALDPGFGFGKTADQGWEMLRRLGEFTGTGRPLLVGVSRKSMFREVLGEDRPPADRDVASGAAAMAAAMQGASIIRTHQVRITRDCLAVAGRLAVYPRL